MAQRLSRSYKEKSIDSIAEYRSRMVASLFLYYSRRNPHFELFFAGQTFLEVKQQHDQDRRELELQASLELLSAIEAQFRIDYAIRCERRYKDNLSKAFRSHHKRHGLNVQFEDQILKEWELHCPSLRPTLQEVRQAFKFRHWLAHGRYWLLKANVGRFDFDYLYQIADFRIPQLAFSDA